jgi:leader peptidase (prepilin peptidase)/N-methyltransferase
VAEISPALRLLVAAWVFLLGAAIGSFLNVVVARLPAGLSIVRPASRCPRCQAPIAWYDNIPILSWLFLRGRCRRCRAPISFRYPFVEALGGLFALFAFARHGFSLSALAEFALAAALLALSFIDLDTWLLPHVITLPLLFAGVLLSAAGLTATSLPGSLGGAAVGWGSFALLSFLGQKALKKEALGFGDVWLLGAIGAWLGPKALLPVVLLASVQGTLVGVALVLLGRSQPGPTEEAPTAPLEVQGEEHPAGPSASTDSDWVPPRNAVPFGPFLAGGSLEWLWLQGWLAAFIPSLSLFR